MPAGWASIEFSQKSEDLYEHNNTLGISLKMKGAMQILPKLHYENYLVITKTKTVCIFITY